MFDRSIVVLTFFSALGSGLMAGLFFVFSTFMMTALSRLPAAQSIAAMQSINVVILNPLFGLVFSGTALASILLAIVSFFRLGEPAATYLLAGSLLYLIGSVLVTIVFNVPLNDMLASADPGVVGPDLWTRYVASWTPWNHVRTISTIASLVCFIIAFRHSS
ncbi:hypothetical protein BK120_09660 [Paenibacillus sp. FSL A5-0031]|uniref:anthrone oxygenase family protein n=1 Tax=Paenibacillus sp. FSL A5-0031 TaxID=1920420 RepID=UPI00096F1C05|nr:anthrone oxygenase family protein [Paenibacillus sp. FSL A5-0031]OME86223.1 hypothetical protein BK120_09660 [Paenibacillus sp. FSL A5-0031]